MPNTAFPLQDGGRKFERHPKDLTSGIRHSFRHQSVFKNSRSRSLGRNRGGVQSLFNKCRLEAFRPASPLTNRRPIQRCRCFEVL